MRSKNFPTPPSSFDTVSHVAAAFATAMALPMATLMPATLNMLTSFSPSPKAMTLAGYIGVGDAVLRWASRRESAVPLLCAAGMSSRQNVRAWVSANALVGVQDSSIRRAAAGVFQRKRKV